MKVNAAEEGLSTGTSPSLDADGSYRSCIFEMDLEGNFRKVPPAMEAMTGFSKEELDLLSMQSITLVGDRPLVTSSIQRIAAGEPIVIFEVQVFSERKGSIPVEVIMLPLGKGLKPEGTWGIFNDTSSRRNLLDRLRSSKEALGCTREFMGDLIGLMAREMKQTLTSLLLTLEMLDNGFYGEMNDLQKEKVGQVLEMVERLKVTLNEAIETSRDVREEVVLEREVVDLRSIVEDAVRGSSEVLKGRGLKVIENYPEGQLRTPADRKALMQTVSHLLERSISQSPEGGHVMVDVELQGDVVQFTISDSGKGLPESELRKMFDRLQLDPEKEREFLSDGLNLYMAKRMIEQHGGRIWCESYPGLGTTFFFTLPIAPNKEGGRT